MRASGSSSHDLCRVSVSAATMMSYGSCLSYGDPVAGRGGAGAASWMGEKPYFVDETPLRGDAMEWPRSESPRSRPAGAPFR